MKKISFSLFIITLAFFGCQSTGPSFSRYIPEKPMGVVYLENPKASMNDTWAALESIGVVQAMGATTLEAQLASIKEATNNQLDPAWIDFSRPMAIAFNGPEELFIALPYSPSKEAQDGLKSYLETTMQLKTLVQDGWVLAGKTLPAQGKGFNLSLLSKSPMGGVQYYADLKALKTMAGLDNGDWLKSIRSSLANSGSNEASVTMILDVVETMVTQASTWSGSFALNPQGLFSTMDLAFADGGTLQGYLNRVKPVSGTREFLKYLPQDYLMGFAGNLDLSVFRDEIKTLSQKIYKDMDLSPELLAAVEKYEAASAGQITGRGAGAFDIDLDFNKIASGKISEGLGFSLVMVTEVNDAAAYQKIMADYYGSGLADRIISATNAASPVKINYGYKGNQNKDGLTYDLLELSFAPGASGGMTDMTVYEVLKTLDLNLYMAYSGKKVYTTFGKGGFKLLKDMVAKDAFPGKSWAQGGLETQDWVYPDNAHVAGNLSVYRLMQIIRQIPQASMAPMGIQGSPGLTGWARIEGGKLLTGSSWNGKEMEAVVKPLAAFIPMMISGQ